MCWVVVIKLFGKLNLTYVCCDNITLKHCSRFQFMISPFKFCIWQWMRTTDIFSHPWNPFLPHYWLSLGNFSSIYLTPLYPEPKTNSHSYILNFHKNDKGRMKSQVTGELIDALNCPYYLFYTNSFFKSKVANNSTPLVQFKVVFAVLGQQRWGRDTPGGTKHFGMFYHVTFSRSYGAEGAT